jgi:hypothetical protein
VSTPSGPISTYRPVVNIATSDVVGTPQELAAQVTYRLRQLICGDASTIAQSCLGFRNALASQAGTFHVEHARTWTDLLKEATSSSGGRTSIPALRPGQITVDPTEFLMNNGVPRDVSPSSPRILHASSTHPPRILHASSTHPPRILHASSTHPPPVHSMYRALHPCFPHVVLRHTCLSSTT